VTATDIRVVFHRLLTPDADLVGLTGEMESLANAPSVKFNSQLSLDKEAVVHYVHNESSNALIMDSGSPSGPMTLNLGETSSAGGIGNNKDGSSAASDIDSMFSNNGFSLKQVTSV